MKGFSTYLIRRRRGRNNYGKILNTVFLLIFLLSIQIRATALVNGRFVLLKISQAEYSIKFQINTDTGSRALGCSTIIFDYDSTTFSFPASPVDNVDYKFLNFNDSNYISTVTRPLHNQIWINIESIYSNKCITVSKAPEWTDVVQINFKFLGINGSMDLNWQTNDDNWAIYDSDNLTMWRLGAWTEGRPVPLPVELTTFSASANNKMVKLIWQTATEINNYGFEIERAVKSDNLEWEKIGFIPGKEQSSTITNYSFTDDKPVFSKAVYRLKQIDIKGSFEYSNEIEVDLSPKSFLLQQNYPNPFNPSTTINYSLPYKTYVIITVYDLIGQKVRTLVDAEKPPGSYQVKFNALNTLSSGIYFYKMITANFTQVKKMLLLK